MEVGRGREREITMAGLQPRIIVLALGTGALGFPDALRLLLDVAGRSPLLDIAICIVAMGMVTAHVLGTMLLARFVRNAAAGPATDRFAQMTLVVSLGVCFVVFVCLLVAPGAGGLGKLCLIAEFAGKSPVIAILVVVGAAVLPCTSALLRIFREAGNAHGAAPAARATERFVSTSQTASLAGLSVVAVVVLSRGLGAQRSPFVDVSVAVATVVGTMLLARFFSTARNAAGASGGAAPAAAAAPATDTRRFSKVAPVTSLAVVSVTVACLLVTAYASPGVEPDGAKYPFSG